MTPAAAASRARPDPGQRRTAILDATLRLIAKGGVDSVTHRRVAAEAGVSLSSTTYYFATREDIIHEAFRHKLSLVASPQPDDLDIDVETPEQAVEALVEWARRQLESPDQLLAEYELMLYTARDQSLASELDVTHRMQEMRIAATLERLGVDRPLDAAQMVCGVMRSFEIECLTRPKLSLDDLRRRFEILIPALVSGTSSEATGDGPYS